MVKYVHTYFYYVENSWAEYTSESVLFLDTAVQTLKPKICLQKLL